jgi:hypothetical protein
MPVRNHQASVGAAIHGLAKQTLSDFELIVIDDGSTDRTCDIVREWAARDARVKLVRLSRRLGLGAALNFGMGACRSQIVAYAPAVADSRGRITSGHDVPVSWDSPAPGAERARPLYRLPRALERVPDDPPGSRFNAIDFKPGHVFLHLTP